MFTIDRQLRSDERAVRRVLVDVTTSLHLAEMSPIGILRVEEQIARRLLAFSDLNPVPVVFRSDGCLCALSPHEAARIFAARLRASSPQIRFRNRPALTATAATPLKSYPSRLVRRCTEALRLRVTARLRRAARAGVARMPGSVREDVRMVLIHSRQILRHVVHKGGPLTAITPLRGAAQPEHIPALCDEILPTLRMIVHPGPDDVLWTAGLYGNVVPLRTIAEMRARTGLSVVTTCYDLIRVMHPEFNPSSMATELFEGDAAALLDASDLVLAISEATRRDLMAFAERSGRAVPILEVFQLGSDLTMDQPGLQLDNATIPNGFPPRPFALAVGTIEPRKNFGLLVRVWERLASDQKFALDLVIVGKQGFGAENSAAEIERSPLFGRRIHWIESCPDAMLRHLYATCHVLLYPSFAEGWGLPVTEALLFGRHVIASNRGAILEASQGRAVLLDPEDEARWLAAIAETAAGPARTVSPPQMPSWDAAAATVAGALRRCMNRVRVA